MLSFPFVKFRIPFVASVALALLPACAAHSQDDQRSPDPHVVISTMQAFEKQPGMDTWAPIRSELRAPSDQVIESSVEALTEQDIPSRILDAAAVDLAAADWTGAMRWVRQYNVAAGTDPSATGRGTVNRTARLAWLLLALRASYVRDAVDLSRTDLRDDAAFIGQAMNLSNVDFTGSRLTGGTWRNANLGGALFVGAVTAGALHCASCGFGSLRYPGTLTLVNG
ncbi:MAG: pentapeptide repeat-containing protein, partial [Candidatus Eremiobacteraeota bacterium]|nr:pentapeptide repeat-containing protein [Candidatus Eremiobacteraeota bacterium]